MVVLQIAVMIGGYWWLLNPKRPRLRPFFEKLEKKQDKLEKNKTASKGI
jgi:hypothetical protein